MACSILIILLPSWGPDISVSTGSTGSLDILRNADPLLVQGSQDFWSVWGRIQYWVYRAKKLLGLVSKPWLDILGKHPGGQRIGWSCWVGLPGRVPTCVILTEWHGSNKPKLLPTPAEYSPLCRIPGFCPS